MGCSKNGWCFSFLIFTKSSHTYEYADNSNYIFICFILAWNSFAWPLLILTKEDWFPVTVSIYSFIREAGTNYNLLMAASLISIFPVLLLYFFTQRLFLESISNFGIKQ